ncbi:hypothetical protein SLA2020_430000 [Shorea laevis]
MPFVMALFRCTGFVDVETGTNPIDRSIAHLLFHRPSDASVMPANNAFSPKSHALINGSEDTIAIADKKRLMTDNK